MIGIKKKIAYAATILAIASCFVLFNSLSCDDDYSNQRMNVSKFKGYVVIKKTNDSFKMFDVWILRKGDTVIKAKLPTMFSEVYQPGDTIK